MSLDPSFSFDVPVGVVSEAGTLMTKWHTILLLSRNMVRNKTRVHRRDDRKWTNLFWPVRRSLWLQEHFNKDLVRKYFALGCVRCRTLSEPLKENGGKKKSFLKRSGEELPLHPSSLTFLPHSVASPPACGWRQVAWAAQPICDLQGEISSALVPGHLGSVLNGQERRRSSGKIQPRRGGESLRNIREQGLIILYPFYRSLSLFIHLNSSAFAMCCKLTAPHALNPQPRTFSLHFKVKYVERARFALCTRNICGDVERKTVNLSSESRRLGF